MRRRDGMGRRQPEMQRPGARLAAEADRCQRKERHGRPAGQRRMQRHGGKPRRARAPPEQGEEGEQAGGPGVRQHEVEQARGSNLGAVVFVCHHQERGHPHDLPGHQEGDGVGSEHHGQDGENEQVEAGGKKAERTLAGEEIPAPVDGADRGDEEDGQEEPGRERIERERRFRTQGRRPGQGRGGLSGQHADGGRKSDRRRDQTARCRRAQGRRATVDQHRRRDRRDPQDRHCREELRHGRTSRAA